MKKENAFIIENEHIIKKLVFKSSKLKECCIVNKISYKVLTPLENSEEFIITFKTGFLSKKIIKASELKLKVYEHKEDSPYHIFVFAPVKVKGCEIEIKLVFELKSEMRFIKKHIELSVLSGLSDKIILDCIEFERLFFDNNLNSWSIPKQSFCHIPGYALEMGQPVYVGSLFFGLEFPISYNKIEDGGVTVRFYSGKRLSELTVNSAFKSYQSVMGVAEGEIFAQVQKAFFEYIAFISKPAKLRRQYNSWYDHMLNITTENLTASFLEIEKAMTSVGEKALDSYVADDGWNDYKKDFWCFNSKFPNELYPMRELSEAFGSKFGLWLGPRGGYTSDTVKFAARIQKAGNGYLNKQAKDICVADKTYVDKTAELMLDYQQKFHLNYWKLDGFAQFPCKCKKHGHMVGGFRNMYYYTDVWEKWIAVFNRLSEEGGDDYWLNLTSYTPPSAWFLKYVNCLWMQVSNDVGFVGKKGQVTDKDRMLTYRDDRYYDFYRERQFQVPGSRLYNHDPIYGNEAKVELSDDEFREYLFTMAMRGSQFWELYYSYNMMNKAKWRINYSVLRFMEDNIDALSHSVIFGSKPGEEKIYGYSCFKDFEGIIGIRNASSNASEYIIRLDENIGVSKRFIYGKMTQIIPYKGVTPDVSYAYGDTIKISLAPYETKILHFGRVSKKIDATYIKAKGQNTLEITFNQFVNISEVKCDENKIESIELLEDYMSILITFKDSFAVMNNYNISGILDLMGNKNELNVAFDYYNADIITEGVFGKGDFTIKATLDGEDEKILYQQGDEINLYIGSDGFIHFKTGFGYLKSKSTVQDVVQVTAVRERNGVLKLYLNGKLDSGIQAVITDFSGNKGICYDEGKVVLYNKALSYDEV